MFPDPSKEDICSLLILTEIEDHGFPVLEPYHGNTHDVPDTMVRSFDQRLQKRGEVFPIVIGNEPRDVAGSIIGNRITAVTAIGEEKPAILQAEEITLTVSGIAGNRRKLQNQTVFKNHHRYMYSVR